MAIGPWHTFMQGAYFAIVYLDIHVATLENPHEDWNHNDVYNCAYLVHVHNYYVACTCTYLVHELHVLRCMESSLYMDNY